MCRIYFINCCVCHRSSYKFNPLVHNAVNPVGNHIQIPLPDALVPAEDMAVVPKYPLPKFASTLS